MLKQSAPLVAVLCLTAGTAQAACPLGAQVLIACDLKGGTKRVETCLIGDQALYRYGTPGQRPELEMLRPVTHVGMTPWPGVSRTIWEGISFFNDDVEYEVSYSMDRDPEATEIRGGIAVLRDGSTIASLECDPGTVVTSGYSLPLFEAKEAAGQCWDFTNFEWVSGC